MRSLSCAGEGRNEGRGHKDCDIRKDYLFAGAIGKWLAKGRMLNEEEVYGSFMQFQLAFAEA